MASDLEMGYIAGIVDGEGTIGFYNGYLRIQVKMTDLDVLEKLKALLGGTVCPAKQTTSLGTKPMWRWTLSDQTRVIQVLQAIYPIVSVRRQDKIVEVLLKYENKPLGPRGRYAQQKRCQEVS